MKKIVLTLGAAFLLVTGAQAQTGFGLKAGVNMPSYSYGSSDNLSDTKSAVNFYVTGYINANMGSNFAIQPGVSFQGKGAKFVEAGNSSDKYEIVQNTSWVEVPVNFVGKLPLGGSEIQIGAGPYVGFGLSGKNKLNSYKEGGDGSSTTLNEFEFGKDKTLKGLDYGANILAGFKLSNGLLINANYSLGLADLSTGSFISTLPPIRPSEVKNRVFSVGIGFEF